MDAAVAETHSAIVFFAGDRAYKVKKPVDLGFLDFSTAPARRAALERELELNRRLAPDVYLGVFDVVDGSGVARDHVLEMVRMPEDRRLATLIEDPDADLVPEIERLAARVAAFHTHAARNRAVDEAAGAAATADRWRANSEELRELVGDPEDAVVERIDVLAARYIEGRGPLFARRVDQGRACDGHGDLMSQDIFCLDDGPRILDCIEFDDALRAGDALADVAFLAMDLEHRGRADLAETWMHRYRTLAGDHWPDSLAHHHIAYRAQVRAKVAAIRARQGDAEGADACRALLARSVEHLEAGKVRLVAVGGPPGAGKSTVAAGLGARLDALVLRSDVVRKELAGLAPHTRAGAALDSGLYDPAHTAATYAELFHRAATALEAGESVILDASFTDVGHRADVEAVAEVTHTDLTALWCTADPAVTAERMRRRDHDPSDATPAVAAALRERAVAWPRAVTIDTTPPVDEVVRTAAERVR